MKLVDNAGSAWRWLSVQIAAAIVILPEVWAMMPADVKAMVPPEWEMAIVQLMAVALILGRLKDQGTAKK
jgi:hypothetical protein